MPPSDSLRRWRARVFGRVLRYSLETLDLCVLGFMAETVGDELHTRHDGIFLEEQPLHTVHPGLPGTFVHVARTLQLPA